jgi:hypothetical protein
MDFVGWQNISALTIEAGVNPDDAWKLWASFHLFNLVEPADTWYGIDGRPFQFYMGRGVGERTLVSLEGDPSFDKALAQELDVSLGFRPEENLNFEGHFGAWFPGKWQEQAFDQKWQENTQEPAPELGMAYTVYLLAEVSW